MSDTITCPTCGGTREKPREGICDEETAQAAGIDPDECDNCVGDCGYIGLCPDSFHTAPAPDTDTLVRKTLTDCRGDTYAALDALASQLKAAQEENERQARLLAPIYREGGPDHRAEVAEAKLARVTKAADALTEVHDPEPTSEDLDIQDHYTMSPLWQAWKMRCELKAAYREVAKEETP